MCLYITTSKGLYNYNLKENILNKIIGNWNKGLFKKPSKGFFGICEDNNKNQIITVSRERFSVEKFNNKSTDLLLHFYDPINKMVVDKVTIKNIYDVHQIYYYNKKIYLTDTGKNRVQIYNCETKKIESFIDIGSNRNNHNHVNAIHVDQNKILIGLNNGNKENLRNAQIIEIDQKNIKSSNLDALNIGKTIELTGIYHTHDIEKIGDDYFISASEDGKLISLNKLSSIKKLPIWTRGIAKNKDYIFVGKSGIASRKLRHSRYYDGMVSVLSRNDLNLVNELSIPKIGQLNDILYHEVEN